MTDLSETELGLLRRLASRIIPASSEFGVPGADDGVIFAEILAALQPSMGPVREMLEGMAAGSAGSRSSAEIDGLLQQLAERQEPALAVLIAVVAQCYYRDDRVMRSLGMEPRAPFPLGFEVEEGDWTLLDPVRAMPRLWRDAP